MKVYDKIKSMNTTELAQFISDLLCGDPSETVESFGNFLCSDCEAAGVVSNGVITIGVLAAPIIMAIKFSWYWLFLYVGYLLAALYLAVYAVIKSGSNSE